MNNPDFDPRAPFEKDGPVTYRFEGEGRAIAARAFYKNAMTTLGHNNPAGAFTEPNSGGEVARFSLEARFASAGKTGAAIRVIREGMRSDVCMSVRKIEPAVG